MTVNVFALDSSDLSAECAVLISEQTGEIIFQKNAFKKHSMASTTKIMTALLAAESGKLADELIVSKKMISVEGTSMGLLPGDFVSVNDLIYGMLLSSGNDAANATAFYLGGNVENFAAMMNAKAKEIGMKSTSFVTPSGLDDDKHFSTAYDMALLGRYAVKNPIILSACSSKKASLSFGNPPYRRTLYNHNRLLNSYEYALGIKTGFTKKSGRCLVSYAKKDEMGLIAVTLNDPNDWNDHISMFNFGFNELKKNQIKPNLPASVTVVGGNVENLKIFSNQFLFYGRETDKLTQQILLEHFVYAPIQKNDKIGEVKYYYEGKYIGSTDIFAENNIPIKKTDSKNKGFLKKIKERLFND